MAHTVMAMDIGMATEKTQMILMERRDDGTYLFKAAAVMRPKTLLHNVDIAFNWFEDYGVPYLLVFDDWFSIRHLGEIVLQRFNTVYPDWHEGNHKVWEPYYQRLTPAIRQEVFNQIKNLQLAGKIEYGDDMIPISQVMSAAILGVYVAQRTGKGRISFT